MKNNIPPYLGLGILDPTSLVVLADETTANYTLFAEHTSTVKITENSFTIIEYYCGEFISICSAGANLHTCILLHYAEWDPLEDQRFIILREAVCALGNIYFESPIGPEEKKLVLSFSPSGRLLVLRLRAPKNDTVYTQKLINSFKDILLFGHFDGNCERYSSTQTLYFKDDEPLEEDILVIEFVVPLAYIYEAAHLLVSKGLVLADTKYQCIIQDWACKTYECVRLFNGDERDDWSSIFIAFKKTKPNFADYGGQN